MIGIQQTKKIISIIRDAWLITGVTIVLFFLGHYILGAAYNIKDVIKEVASASETIKEKPDKSSENSPVYAGFSEKNKFWEEHKKAWNTHFEPYYHWRRDSFTGKYTNVSSEGVRLTVREVVESGAKKRIFMLGGSTLWGTGSPDSKTIPSILQSLLEDNYEVYNLGETGYVSTQELNYLLYQLSIGNIPDAVIFYDGVNDGYAGAYSPAIPRDPQKLREREKTKRHEKEQGMFLSTVIKLFSSSNYKRLEEYIKSKLLSHTQPNDKWDKKVGETIKNNSISVIDMYEAHIRQVKAISKEYGFTVFFFWQPNLFSLTRTPDSYEKTFIDNASPVLVESQQEVYRVAKDRFSDREHENIYFLGNVFDEVDESIYIDWCHIGPNGNEIISREIFQRIGKKL